jgi:hypothetical protein
MKNLIRFPNLKISIILISVILIQSCKDKPIEADNFNSEILTSWNKKIMELSVAEDGLLTLKGVRTEAMMHIAIHDALNTIQPLYSNYIFQGVSKNANPISTVAQAAYEIAVSHFPDKQEELEAELNKWLTTINDDDSKAEGVNLGKEVASNIIKNRFEDNWNGEPA